jgi:hypothetical protein
VASSEFHRDLTVDDNATITIHGERFNYPLMQPITDATGTIRGTLSDGRAIAWSFARAPRATIRLVPEPAAISMFAAAMLAFLIVDLCQNRT